MRWILLAVWCRSRDEEFRKGRWREISRRVMAPDQDVTTRADSNKNLDRRPASPAARSARAELSSCHLHRLKSKQDNFRSNDIGWMQDANAGTLVFVLQRPAEPLQAFSCAVLDWPAATGVRRALARPICVVQVHCLHCRRIAITRSIARARWSPRGPSLLICVPMQPRVACRASNRGSRRALPAVPSEFVAACAVTCVLPPGLRQACSLLFVFGLLSVTAECPTCPSMGGKRIG